MSKCLCGCGEETPLYTTTHTNRRTKQRRVAGEPMEYIPGHKRSLVERFWANAAVIDDEDSCWHWTAKINSDGYGEIRAPRMTKAHRASWEIHFGPIPDGQSVLHRCDAPSCVRPSHLFLGTHLENMADMRSKGRGHGGFRLSSADVRSIRARSARGVRYRELAIEYGVTKQTIGEIVRRVKWKRVA